MSSRPLQEDNQIASNRQRHGAAQVLLHECQCQINAGSDSRRGPNPPITHNKNLEAFIDTGFTAHHDVAEYWDGGALKVFRGVVTMTPDDKSQGVVRPTMTHFFYMDEADPT
jgi:hypothetical protein